MATAAEPEPTASPEPRAKPPFLRRVRIQNYKSIAFCDVTLEPLTVFVGRNGSGKSNFLDALAFVRDILATNLTEAVRRRGTWESVLCRSASEARISVELELGLEDSRPGSPAYPVTEFGFTIGEGPFGPPVVFQEWLCRRDESGRLGPRYTRNSRFETVDGQPVYVFDLDTSDLPLGHGPNPGPDQLGLYSQDERPGRGAAEWLRSTGYYNFDPRLMRVPQRSVPGSLLEGDGRNLAGLIETVRRLDPGQVERAGQFLSVVVGEVERFEVVPIGGHDLLRFWVRQGEDRPAIPFDAASMSDGTLRALAALMAVYQVHQPSGPHLVGIEEPETALHPAAANALVGALDEATLSTQVIITTHSPDLLDHPDIRPWNVRVVRMVDGRTLIGTVDEAGREIVQDGLNTLGGLERGDTLDIDADDLDRQLGLSRIGAGPPR